MQGIKPCPYCGGEVEMVKLKKLPKDKKQPFRISCYQCHALVAHGRGFPIESVEDMEQRVKDYEKYMEEYWSPLHSTRIKQSREAKRRDRVASKASRIDIHNDEEFETHDYGMRRGIK